MKCSREMYEGAEEYRPAAHEIYLRERSQS